MTQVYTEILERFKRLVKAKRLAHAYLFTGPQGIGKTATALKIAQLVNCENEANAPCCECASCRKIESGNHPDIHRVALLKDEKTIGIDQARVMLGRVALKAYEARVKVFIISDFDLLTRDAANSLLKTLEEPASNTLMILTTAVPDACLDTIRSRCHAVKFILSEEKMPEDRERILDMFLRQNSNDDFFKSLSIDKNKTADAMFVLLSLVRDAFVVKAGGNKEALVNQERMGDLDRLSKRELDELSALHRQIVHVKSLSDENLNVKMALSLVRERIWGN